MDPNISSNVLLQLFSLSFWTGLYLFCQTRGLRQSPEWSSRVVTLLHGTVASVIGLSQCQVNDLTKQRLTMPVTSREYALMVWSWGYFAFDLLWCLIYWPRNYVMLVHHGSSLLIITYFMNKEFSGCCFACGLVLTEITNPLLQARWFLKEDRQDRTVIFTLIEVSYLVLFIALRGVLGTYVVYRMYFSQIFDVEEKLLALLIYIVSLIFVYDIVGYTIYKYKNQIVGISHKSQRMKRTKPKKIIKNRMDKSRKK